MENETSSAAPAEDQIEINAEDLAQIFNYPSVGQLFDEKDPQRLGSFLTRLKTTRDSLERVIRYGSRDEAEKAQKASNAIKITLEFLDTLQKMRLNHK